MFEKREHICIYLWKTNMCVFVWVFIFFFMYFFLLSFYLLHIIFFLYLYHIIFFIWLIYWGCFLRWYYYFSLISTEFNFVTPTNSILPFLIIILKDCNQCLKVREAETLINRQITFTYVYRRKWRSLKWINFKSTFLKIKCTILDIFW